MGRILLPAIAGLLFLLVICDDGQARGGWRRGGGWSQPASMPVVTVQPRPVVDHRDRLVDGSAGYNADLITDLPQAAEERLYLTLTTSSPPTSRDAELFAWFSRDPRLVHFRSQTHFNHYTTASPHYRERLYKSYGTAVPIVTLQKPDGEILLHVYSGPDGKMPATSGELADMINASVQQRYAPPSFSHVEGSSGPTIIRETDCPDDSCQPVPDLGPATPIDQVAPQPDGGSGWGLVGVIVAGLVFCGLVLVIGLGGTYIAARQPATDDGGILPPPTDS